ncbi:MAG: hypothetical protein JW943_14605 [Deltaproteobacteria bacterium]|nr:hypothetical protein [Deltaproteobacteria bacterium]
MSDDYTKIFENLKRQQHRKNLHRIWTLAISNKIDELTDEECKIAEIMMEHEEFHNKFDMADQLMDHDFD